MITDINGYPLSYTSYGEGRPIFFFPGWSMSAYTMAHYHEPIFTDRQGWQRIYIDPPGHGRSPADKNINSLDDMLEIINHAIDHLTGARSFSLFGLSAGAYLSRAILHKRQQEVLGLMMTVPLIVPENQKRDVPALSVIYEEPGIMDNLQEDEKEMFAIAVVRTQKFLNGMRASEPPQGEINGDMAYLSTMRENPLAYKLSFDVDNLPAPFPGPTAIITCRQDVVVGYQDAWKILNNYPRATFVVADRAGHFLEEKSEIIQTICHDWLDRIEEYDQQ